MALSCMPPTFTDELTSIEHLSLSWLLSVIFCCTPPCQNLSQQNHIYTVMTFSVSPLQVESLYHKLRVLLHACDVLLNLSKHCKAESWYQYWIPTPFYWRAFQLSTHNGVSILPKQRLNLLVTFFHFIKNAGYCDVIKSRIFPIPEGFTERRTTKFSYCQNCDSFPLVICVAFLKRRGGEQGNKTPLPPEANDLQTSTTHSWVKTASLPPLWHVQPFRYIRRYE